MLITVRKRPYPNLVPLTARISCARFAPHILSCRVASLGLLVLCSTYQPLFAQTWVSGGASARWSDAANWSPAGVPRQDGTADLSFVDGTESSPQVDVTWAVRSINFYGSSVSFTLAGQSVRIGQGGLVNNSSLIQTVSTPFVLTAAQIWSAEQGPLVVGGTVDNSGHTLFLGGSFPMALRGSLSGQGAVVKKGSSVLSLLAANSFSGGFSLESGVLLLGDDGALGSGAFHPGNGLITGGVGRRVLPNPIVMDTAEDPAFAGQADLVFSGPLRLGGNRAIDVRSGHRVEFSGQVEAMREETSLLKTGPGTLILSGSIPGSLARPLRVGEGVVVLNKEQGVAATLGGLEIGGGAAPRDSAVVRWRNDNQIPDESRVIVWESGWLDLDGHSETVNLVLAGGRVTSGSGTLTLADDLSSKLCQTQSRVEGTLDLGGRERLFNIVDAIPGADVVIQAEIKNGAVIKSGSGGVVLVGKNTFSGGLVVESGTLELAHDAGAGTGVLELAHTGVRLKTAGGARQLSNPVVWNGEITLDGQDDVTFLGASLLTGDLTLNVKGLGRKVFSGPIDERFSHRILTKRGPGEVVLAGPNRTQGEVDAQEGWLTLSHPQAVGGSVVRLSGAGLRLGDSPNSVVISSLLMAAGTALEMRLAAPNGPALARILETFELKGVLSVRPKQGFVAGVYPLFSHQRPLGAGAALTFGSMPPGFRYSLVQSKVGEIALAVEVIEPVLDPVRLLMPRIGTLGFGFSFQTQVGRLYRVESNPGFGPSGWNQTGVVVGDGRLVDYFHNDLSSVTRFYRVITE